MAALLPLIRFQPVKLETRRQRTPQLAHPLYGLLGTAIASDPKCAPASGTNFHLVALFEVQRFHYR